MTPFLLMVDRQVGSICSYFLIWRFLQCFSGKEPQLKGHTGAVKLFLTKGASTKAKNESKHTPFTLLPPAMV